MRMVLGIAYNGYNYHGWQRQEALLTIQQILENAITKVADHPIEVTCAGRTDRGVHALEQIVHFDTEAIRNSRGWLLGINTHLPADIRVLWVEQITDEFHARFSAIARRYRYIIYNNPISSALLYQQATRHYSYLDETKMQQAAQYLIGEHDFSSYRATECQARSPVRTVHHLTVRRCNRFIIIDIKANAFLHHMVRNIAGVLLAIGENQHSPSWAAEVLAARDRKVGDITAPANGLYFMEAYYPEKFALPKKAEEIFFHDLYPN